MNRLDTARRAQVLKCLAEGMSLRGTARLTGVARMTIEKLMRDLGAACVAYQDKALRNLGSKRVQCDEIWAFCYAKKKNVTHEIQQEHPDAGDVWTWTAIDADSKLVITWRVGDRSNTDAFEFMDDLAQRLRGRIQLTTDGWRAYPSAVDGAFGVDVDFATLNKIYKSTGDGGKYGPAECIGCETKILSGDPDPGHISTSYVPRWTGQNRPFIDTSKPAISGERIEASEFYRTLSPDCKSVWTLVRQLRGPHFRTCA